MGICDSKEDSDKRNHHQKSNSANVNQPSSLNSKRNSQPIQEEVVNPKFNDMPEWEGTFILQYKK